MFHLKTHRIFINSAKEHCNPSADFSDNQPLLTFSHAGLLPWEPSPGVGASTHQFLPPHRHRHWLPLQPGGLHAQDASKAAPPQLPNMSHITTRYQARSCALCNTELEDSAKARVIIYNINIFFKKNVNNHVCNSAGCICVGFLFLNSGRRSDVPQNVSI